MQNITRFILTFFIAIPLVFGFGSQTVKQIDEIKNNTGTDILLNPTDKVDINYFTGEKALQSTVDGELEESAVTNTELGYVSGVTSSIQTQIDSKQPTLTGTDGDLYYWNSGLSNLAIGTNGQILQVSALGFPEWADLPPSVSVTTKGDLQTYSTAPDRLPVGTDGQVLQANSATSTGLEWIDPNFYTSPLTTQGDLLYRDATQDTRLGIGTEGQLLTVTSGEPAWQDAPVTLPSQTGNEGLYLTTDGSNASWNEINEDVNEIKNNFLECSGFDGCTQEGTITNGAGVDASSIVSRTTETTAFNPSKLNLSQSLAGTLDYTYTKTASFDGKQLVAYCEIKTSNTGVTFSAGADSVEAGSLEVSSDNSWKYYKIPLVGGATDQYFKIDHSDAATIPDIDVDNCFIGKSTEAIELGTAHFVGSVTYKDNNCNWERSSATYGTLVTPVLNTCFATEVIGNVIAPSPSDNPLITIPNFRTDGYYKIIHQGLKYNDANSANCYFNISKDANESNNSVIWLGGDNRGDNHLTADIRFNQGDTGNVQIIARNTLGTECSVRGEIEISSSWSVYFFPDDNSTIVTQDTELTAKTANEFSAKVDAAGNVLSENYDFINGNCVSGGLGIKDCTFTSEANLTQAPSVTCSADNNTSTATNVCEVDSITPTSFRIVTEATNAGSFGRTDIAFEVKVSKQGTDVNKSATIVGKFEQVEEVNKTLTAAEANEFTAIINTDGTVISENYDFINGNCIYSAGNTTCNYNAGIFTQNPSVLCSPSNNSGANVTSCEINNSTASQVVIKVEAVSNSIFTNDTTVLRLHVSKQGTDVNKNLSGVIINASKAKQEIADIVREDIVSTDLCQVEAYNTSSDTISADTEDIPYNDVVIDNCNAWNNGGNTGTNTKDQYTVQKDGFLLVTTGVWSTAVETSWSIQAYKNGTQFNYCARTNSDSIVIGSCVIDVNSGDLITFRSSDPFTYSPNAGTNVISQLKITELPDTESVLKSLVNETLTKCQTKFLSADISANGSIADWSLANLVVGKNYSLRIMSRWAFTANDNVYIQVTHDGSTLVSLDFGDLVTASTIIKDVEKTTKFKATNTTATFATGSVTGATLRGNSTLSESYIEFCELPDTYVETTEF